MNNLKNIVCESLERFVPHKILRKNSDPEYYNKEIKRLKSKVRKAYKRIRNTSHGGTATTVQKAACSQESGTRGILKIIIEQGG